MIPPGEGPPMERRLDHVSRRQFLLGASTAGLGLVAGCGRLPWQASPPAQLPRIGYLGGRPIPVFDQAFRQGLRDLGYIEGQQIAIDWRFAEGSPDALPEIAR